jgi:hypothetical protein
MTQGWVVYGGMRHAEPQREMFPRSYEIEIQFVFLDESRKLPRIQQYDLDVHVVM